VIDESVRIPKSEIRARTKRLQDQLKEQDVEGALILQRADLFYFAGTIQQSHLYVPVEGEPILMVYKSFERARAESHIECVVPLTSPKKLLSLLEENEYALPATLGLELDVLPANMYFNYKRLFDNTRLVDISHPIRLVRAVKSAYEIERMREASRLADEVSSLVPNHLREGMTELELAGQVEAEARKRGHQGIMRMRLWGSELFFGHLMSGPAAAVPSYLSSPTGGAGAGPAVGQGSSFRKIRRHEPILVDYVFAYQGYMSDHTRIFSLGELPETLVKAHQAMLEVQTLVKDRARPGAKAGDLYELALEKTVELGYEDYFMGGGPDRVRFVGHGIGTEVDEYPFLARGQDLELEAGMTIALEPKLVIPGKGVVGIENTHIVTPNGLEQLTVYGEDIHVI
jgi:Xaa-Pro aminopeptidase